MDLFSIEVFIIKKFLLIQDSTTAVVSASKEVDTEKQNGVDNVGFASSTSSMASSKKSSTLESATLPSDAKIPRLHVGRLPDFSTQPPTQAEQSPIMTVKFTSEPRSITAGTRV